MSQFKRLMGSKPVIRMVTVFAAVCLAVVFVAAGLAVCVFQPTTRILSEQTSAFDLSPFSHEDLVDSAVATRDFSFGDHNVDKLVAQVRQINLNLLGDGKPRVGAPDIARLKAAQTTQETLAVFASASDRYVLDSEAISHLDDVYVVASTAWKVIGVLFILAVAACAHLVYYRGRKGLAPALIGSGAGLLALFVVLGVWAAIDFWSFFALFHSLFFAEGSWVFSYDSLLICMLPTEFWMGMGVIWLIVTCILSILSLFIGIRFRKANQ